jgi:hypothetical protein
MTRPGQRMPSSLGAVPGLAVGVPVVVAVEVAAARLPEFILSDVPPAGTGLPPFRFFIFWRRQWKANARHILAIQPSLKI